MCSQLVFSEFTVWRWVRGHSGGALGVVTYIQNFTPSSIPQCRFVQKLNEHFPSFICFYLPVHFLLLLKSRKKARMPRGSPFLGCPSPVLPGREVPVNSAQAVLSWRLFWYSPPPPKIIGRLVRFLEMLHYMFYLHISRTSFKEVEFEIRFYFECWIISRVSLPEILKYTSSLWSLYFCLILSLKVHLTTQ